MYSDISKKYGGLPQLKHTFQGDVIGLCIFSQVVIILCSVSAIKDLLEAAGSHARGKILRKASLTNHGNDHNESPCL